MKTILFANQKGGVSKSTTAYNFGFFLAQKKNHRVLFIDADSQGSSSKSLRKHRCSVSAFDFYGDKPVSFQKIDNNLVLAAGSRDMKKVEFMTNDQAIVNNVAARLKEAEAAGFDYCVVDTPGADAKCVSGFLVAASHVVVPTAIDTYSVEIALQMMVRIVGIQKHFNKGLVNLGMLPTMLLPGQMNQRRDLEGLIREYSKYVIRAVICNRSAYREAADECLPVWDYTKRQKRDDFGAPVFDSKERPILERVDNKAASAEILKAFDLIYSMVN